MTVSGGFDDSSIIGPMVLRTRRLIAPLLELPPQHGRKERRFWMIGPGPWTVAALTPTHLIVEPWPIGRRLLEVDRRRIFEVARAGDALDVLFHVSPGSFRQIVGGADAPAASIRLHLGPDAEVWYHELKG